MCPIAATRAEGIGAEAPPTRAASPRVAAGRPAAFTPVAPPATCSRVESGPVPHPVASFR
ncbi:DUF6053 domain-containing protein [Lysobacter enzymogenes]|uniref:DUF6053 domain-containing protein n=1 Tax=Lysobacter enzymogenes TaxID=69 RepID=UPI000045B6CD